jgi:malyl-CoA/(S)-citramalyl-CoA lyase
VFSPDPAEVAMAKKIIAAMPDGSGAVMIDGKMQDEATWKQAKVVVDLRASSPQKIPIWPHVTDFEPVAAGFGIRLSA